MVKAKVTFRHLLIYLGMVGLVPTSIFTLFFAICIWLSEYFQNSLFVLVGGIFIGFPLLLTLAFKGRQLFQKQYPQYFTP